MFLFCFLFFKNRIFFLHSNLSHLSGNRRPKLIEYLKHSMYYHLEHHNCYMCLKSDRIAVNSKKRLLSITMIIFKGSS